MKFIVAILLNIMILFPVNADYESILLAIDNNTELKLLNNSCPVEIFRGPEKEYFNFGSFCETDMESCFNKCVDGSSSHCYSLARILQDESIERKYEEQLYSLSCQQGLISACTNRAAGMMRFNPENKKCYANSFKFTCSKSDAWGCTMYGYVLSKGIGVEKNNKLALSVLKIGCKNGIEDEACQYAKSIEKMIQKLK